MGTATQSQMGGVLLVEECFFGEKVTKSAKFSEPSVGLSWGAERSTLESEADRKMWTELVCEH